MKVLDERYFDHQMQKIGPVKKEYFAHIVTDIDMFWNYLIEEKKFIDNAGYVNRRAFEGILFPSQMALDSKFLIASNEQGREIDIRYIYNHFMHQDMPYIDFPTYLQEYSNSRLPFDEILCDPLDQYFDEYHSLFGNIFYAKKCTWVEWMSRYKRLLSVIDSVANRVKEPKSLESSI